MAITRTPGRGHLTAAQLAFADTGRNGPQRLRLDAEAVWRLWLSQGMPPGCLTSGYRPWDEQADLRADYLAGRGGMADTPESSWHPDGVAGDVAEPARSWLRAHGGPAAIFDTVPGEPWHVLIDASHHQEDDDMFTDDDRATLRTIRDEQARIGTRLKEIDTADEFVRTAYLDELGREADPDEVDRHVLNIARGLSQATLLEQLRATPEAIAYRARKGA